jgi:hypothetical protein
VSAPTFKTTVRSIMNTSWTQVLILYVKRRNGQRYRVRLDPFQSVILMEGDEATPV